MGGGMAKFWEDSWNQLPKLGMDPIWRHIKEKSIEEGKEKVSQFWAIRNLEGQRQWELTTKPDLMSDEEWRDF